MKDKSKTGKEKHVTETSHADTQIESIREELHSVNREVNREVKRHDKERIRSIALAMLSYVCLATLLMYISFMGIGLGSYIFLENIEPIVVEHSEDIEFDQQKTDTRPNYDVMLETIRPSSQAYHQGEDAKVEAVIGLEDNIDAEVTYELYGPEGNRLYGYAKEVGISKSNNVLTKAILLTENYEEGLYSVEFKVRFRQNGTKYVLPGKTSFLVKEKPKIRGEGLRKIVQKARPSGADSMTIPLLTLLILLNIYMMLRMYGIDRK